MTKSSTSLNAKSLVDLGLYSSFDVSRWCMERGIQSIYLERQKERLMEVKWVYMRTPCWVVKDAAKPGLILKRFVLRGEHTIDEVRSRAEAWVEAKYDTPLRYVESMRASFPALAVDILEDNLEVMKKIWGTRKLETDTVKSDKLVQNTSNLKPTVRQVEEVSNGS